VFAELMDGTAMLDLGKISRRKMKIDPHVLPATAIAVSAVATLLGNKPQENTTVPPPLSIQLMCSISQCNGELKTSRIGGEE
jgi:hypothetical protein